MKQFESTFSVELRNISRIFVDLEKDSLIEGSLGKITEILVHDEVLFEVKGTNGVLRLDIPLNMIKQVVKEAQ